MIRISRALKITVIAVLASFGFCVSPIGLAAQKDLSLQYVTVNDNGRVVSAGVSSPTYQQILMQCKLSQMPSWPVIKTLSSSDQVWCSKDGAVTTIKKSALSLVQTKLPFSEAMQVSGCDGGGWASHCQ